MHSHESLMVKQRLAENGIVCDDLYALLRDPPALESAAPVLLELLDEIESPAIRTDIVRVVSSAEIPPKPLVEALKQLGPQLVREPEPSQSLASLPPSELVKALERLRSQSSGVDSLAWAIADALRERADVSIYKDLVDVIRDKRFGKARQMLPYALGAVRPCRREAIQVLLEMLPDEEITSQVIDALAEMKAIEAIAAIRIYENSPVPVVRKTAVKALKKLEKAIGRPAPGVDDGSLKASEPSTSGGLVETSANFDLAEIPSFLVKLASKVGGFSRPDIDKIVDCLDEMQSNEEKRFDLQVLFGGREVPVRINIYMSDVDAPDVAIITSSELAGVIEQLMA